MCVQVEESPDFTRDGYDVHSDAHISFTQAALGGEVKIPALSGPIMLKVQCVEWRGESVGTGVLWVRVCRFLQECNLTTR